MPPKKPEASAQKLKEEEKNEKKAQLEVDEENEDEEAWEECEDEEEEEAFEEEEETDEQQEQDEQQQEQRKKFLEQEAALLQDKFRQAESTAKIVADVQRNYVASLFHKGRIDFEPFTKEFNVRNKTMPTDEKIEKKPQQAAQQPQTKPVDDADDNNSANSGGGVLMLGPFFFMILFLLMAPHTKVEESFNVQAMHDFIFGGGCKIPLPSPSTSSFSAQSSEGGNGSNVCEPGLANFDHHNFPGVVPRTSLGALAIASVVAAPMRLASLILPYIKPLIFFGVEEEDIMVPFLTDAQMALLICRFILGSLVCMSIIFLSDSLDTFVFSATKKLKIKNNNSTNDEKAADQDDESDSTPLFPSSALCVIIACTQFHTLYYASRPLPNTFATIGVNLAFGFMLRKMPKLAIFCLAFTTCIFRFDIAVLAVPFCLIMWALGDISFVSGVATGLLSMAASALVVLPLDSVFWTFAGKFQNFKWTWPEFVVLYFNTAENRSSEWGVSPRLWYFFSALPRGLSAGLVLLLLALVARFAWGRTNSVYAPISTQLFLRTTVPSLVFIGMYSLLPHKELRFVLPCFSAFVVPAGYYLSQLVCLPAIKRNGGPSPKWITYIILASIVAALGSIVMMINANKETYPGGKALEFANQQIIEQRAWYIAVDEMKKERILKKKSVSELTTDEVEFMNKILLQQQQQRAAKLSGIRQTFNIFIDAYAGMTGVTRFGKLRNINFDHPAVASNIEDENDDSNNNIINANLPIVTINYLKDENIFNLSNDQVANENPYGNSIKFDFLIVRSKDSPWHVTQKECGGCRKNLLTGEDSGECCCSILKSFPMFSGFNVLGFLTRGEKLIQWQPYIDVIGYGGSKCYLP